MPHDGQRPIAETLQEAPTWVFSLEASVDFFRVFSDAKAGLAARLAAMNAISRGFVMVRSPGTSHGLPLIAHRSRYAIQVCASVSNWSASCAAGALRYRSSCAGGAPPGC